jgi:cysteinyl-tRNA synthetase
MDMGKDKMELEALIEGKSAWDIAAFYTEAFKKDLAALNIYEPNVWCKATDHIPEQIVMIKTLEDKGYTYRTSGGIYFDTSKVKEYNKLSHLPLEQLLEGARVEKNPEKKNLTDFALWKFSPNASSGMKRQMEWESPWGVGFPGWHIECSAMSLKYLAGQLDIHCGGIDHINIHHTNEIAQSEAATGQTFFNYWMHNAFLNIVGGKKMAKSEGNFLTVNNALIQKGINPLAYRFATLQVHYRKPMEYSEEGMQQAAVSYQKLLDQVASLGTEVGTVDSIWSDKFLMAINNDLNAPQALAVVAGVLKSKLSAPDKLATILYFDKALGLGLDGSSIGGPAELALSDLPADIQALVNKRQEARLNKDWAEADRLRLDLADAGYSVDDTSDGCRVSLLK